MALRLVIPFSVTSIFSLLPATETHTPEVIYREFQRLTEQEKPAMPTIPGGTQSQLPTGETVTYAKHKPSAIEVTSFVWFFGMITMLLYAVISYISLRKRTREHIPIEKGVYKYVWS